MAGMSCSQQELYVMNIGVQLNMNNSNLFADSAAGLSEDSHALPGPCSVAVLVVDLAQLEEQTGILFLPVRRDYLQAVHA
jgi:hypothetical protein